MRRALLLPVFLLFGIAIYAQAPDMTPRLAWCEMTRIDDPVAKDFQAACENLLTVYPSPELINKNAIKRKLFLNKMRGVVKRGTTYVKLAPAARNALAASAVKYCNTFLDYEEGDKVETPAASTRGPVAGRADCSSMVLTYDNVGSCYDDGAYEYLSGITTKNKLNKPKTDIQMFWSALQFVAILLECDETHSVYK